MNTLKRGFIIVVALLFLGAIAISESNSGGKGKDPETDSINLNSSRSNIYRDTSSNDVKSLKNIKSDPLSKGPGAKGIIQNIKARQ